MIKQIISDAGPLIALSRINSLFILSKLFGNIIIPRTVAKECLIDLSLPGAVVLKESIKNKIIKVSEAFEKSTVNEIFDVLGAGEAAAIQLALHHHLPLLIDDKLGRTIANKFQLKIIGTAGILLLAKRHKIIKKVHPLIKELKNCGYRLSNELVQEILKQAHEQP